MVKDDAVMKDYKVISEQQQYMYGAPKPEDEFDNAKFQSNTEAVPITTPTPTVYCTQIVLSKVDISNNMTNNNSHSNMYNSKEEEKGPKDGSPNLNGVPVAAANYDDDNNDIDKEKLQLEREIQANKNLPNDEQEYYIATYFRRFRCYSSK